EGETHLDKALEIYRRIPNGEKTIAAAGVYSNLSSCLGGQGRDADSQVAAEKAVAIYRDLLPADHPKLATAYSNLASSLKNQAKYDEADPLFQTALGALEKRLNEDHQDRAHAQANLAV